MPGATPEIVLTTSSGWQVAVAVSGMMKFLPAKKMKLPEDQHLVDERVDDPPERPLDLPPPGEVAVEEVGAQRDE